MSAHNDRDDRDPPGHVVATRVVPTRRRPLVVPAIVVIAVAVAALGFLGQKVVPPAPPPPSVGPTLTPAPVTMTWTDVPVDPAIFRSALVGLVVSTPEGLLAFGQDKTDRHPIAWTSPDGRTWVRHDQPPGTFGGGVPDAAAQVGSSFAAVGYHATVNGITRDIWVSGDGASWARDPSPSGRGFDEVRRLIGSRGTAILIASLGGRQALLTSEDGRLWTAATDLDATLGRQAFIRDAIDSGDGFLAMGSIGSEGAIWRSLDGRRWSRVTQFDPAMFAGARFDQLVRTSDGLLLSGSRDRFGAAGSSWTSSDGVSWVADTTSAVGFQDLGAILPLDGGNLGIPYEAIGGGFGSLTVWADPLSAFSTPSPTDAPTDWSRQASVMDGHVVLLAQDAATEAIGVWLGSLVGSGVVRASPTPGPSGAQGSAASSPSPTPLPTPAQDPAAPAFDWVRLTSNEVLADDYRDVWMAGVANVGSTLVAFGSIGNDAVVWRARDAGHWDRLPISPTMRGAYVLAVAAGPGSRLIAVGDSVSPDGQATPAAWTSSDGIAWKRGTVPSGSGTGQLTDVVAGPGGFVAVGSLDTDQGSRPVVWASTDGSAWSDVPVSPDESTVGAMQAIVHVDAGYVAVGTTQLDGFATVGAAWVSADGRTWSSAPRQVAFTPPVEQTPERGGGVSITDVVAGGPGFVAVGSVDARNGTAGAIFTSPDGNSWTRLALDAVLDGAYLRRATTWAGGLAVAGEMIGYAGSDPAIWTSRDGVAWAPLGRADLNAGGIADHQDVSLAGIAGYGPDLIGVGASGNYPARQQGAIWVGAPSGELVPDHVCPSSIDTLAVVASMSAADRAACIDRRGVTIEALVQGSDSGGCSSETPDELSGCGAMLSLAPLEGGSAVLSVPVDASLLATFGTSAFAPWSLTFRTGVAGPRCIATPSFNAVVYDPLDSVRLQCLGVLRLIASSRIPTP